ncbi:MAG: FAD-dependent oxidoreductase, partial [bacterium]
ARRDEIEHAKEEGIHFMLLTSPKRVVGKSKVEGLECLQMMLGEPDETGRRRPVAIENSEFIINCDQIIIAIGRTPNPLIIKDSNLHHTMRGNLKVNESLQTSDPQIFAGGDITRGETTVIEAMGDGKTAAKEILKFLS